MELGSIADVGSILKVRLSDPLDTSLVLIARCVQDLPRKIALEIS